MHSLLVALLVPCVLLAACAGDEPFVSPGASGYVTVPRMEYSVERHGPMSAVVLRISVRNPSDSAVFLPRCGQGSVSFHLERKSEAGWRSVFEPECPLVWITPFAIAPGEVREFDLLVTAPGGSIEPSMDLTGLPAEHRLVLPIYRTFQPEAGAGDLEGLLDISLRTSNSFVLSRN